MADLFVADYTVGDAPQYNYDGIFSGGEGTLFDTSTHTAGGPNGEDTVQWDLIVQGGAGQSAFGHTLTSNSLSNPSANTSWFVRIRWRLTEGANYIDSGIKVVDVGSGGDTSTGRCIMTLEGRDGGEWWVHTDLNAEGGVTRVEERPAMDMTPGTWYSDQWEIHLSTDGSTADGYHKFWRDSDNASYASPTGVSGSFVQIASPWVDSGSHYVGVGGIAFDYALSGEQVGLEVAAFEIGDTFKDTWGTGGGGGGSDATGAITPPLVVVL